MKRTSTKAVLSLAIVLMLLVSLCAPAFAARIVLSNQNLKVNGEAVDCEKYNIDGYNYFKLRDLAELLNGTESQFDVDYDQAANAMIVTTGTAYTHKNGTELKLGVDNSATAVATRQSLVVDGETVTGVTVYNIGGVNFFRLRELGQVAHFYVHYDEPTRTMLVDEQEEDEDWTTGDASLDKARNEDGIGATEVLVISFGTSFNNSRRVTIGAIEEAMEKAFPDYSVRRGFTANIVIDHIARRDDVTIDDLNEALDRAVANGVKNLLVQPTHLMDGFEYTDVKNELAKYESKFDKIVLGAPILTSDKDYDTVIKTITDGTKEYLDGKTAICFMGHGTEAASNHVYADIQSKLTAKGFKDYFIGTVEAEPSLEDVVKAVKAAGYTKVVLEPLMIVAGDHANNDMAGDEDSWKTMFEAEGIEVQCLLRGLGEFPEIQQLLVEHLKAAIGKDAPAANSSMPTRDLADKTDYTAVKDVEEEGMTAITGDKVKDGTYDVEVKSSSSMFRITNAKLTVKSGKMTAVLTLSGKSYTWMFADGTDKIAAAADSDFIAYKEDADGAFTFEVPVEALDKGLSFAAYSKNKDQWYARTLLFRADSLPAEALSK